MLTKLYFICIEAHAYTPKCHTFVVVYTLVYRSMCTLQLKYVRQIINQKYHRVSLDLKCDFGEISSMDPKNYDNICA